MQPIISLATIAKIASVALLGATAAGVGVLTWATITTQGDEQTEPAAQADVQTSNTPTPSVRPTQTPPTGSRFTADQAIVYAAQFSDAENVSDVEATLMTYEEARAFTKNSTIFPNEPDPDSPTWLIAFSGRFDSWMLGDFSRDALPAPLAKQAFATRAQQVDPHEQRRRGVEPEPQAPHLVQVVPLGPTPHKPTRQREALGQVL